MIPMSTPAGTPIVHTSRDGLRRAGTTTRTPTIDGSGRAGVGAILEDGTRLVHAGLDYFEPLNPTELDPPQLALFTLE